MAWVHVECLDRWRRTSANPQSFYRCDQCHYEYQFGRAFTAYGHGFGDKITIARLLSSRVSIVVVSTVVLLMLVFVAGFFAKIVGISPTPVAWSDALKCFNLNHWISGSMLVGLGSLSGFLIETLGSFYRIGRVGGVWGQGWGGGARVGSGGGDAQKIIVGIMVVIGLLVALRWIYVRLQILAASAARRTQDVILDADDLHEPRIPAVERDAEEAEPTFAHDDFGTPPRER
jgi:hypothetical protein